MKTYRLYEPDQVLLLPPSLDDWLPKGHLARFVAEIVEDLELETIVGVYEREERGQPPYNPRMMVKILVYAYCVGLPSSRRIERGLVEDVALRYLAANNTPDFRTISDFRKRHLRRCVDYSCRCFGFAKRREWSSLATSLSTARR